MWVAGGILSEFYSQFLSCFVRFDVIERCWSQDPDQRSLYPDILQALNVLLIDCDSHIRLEDLPALSFSGGEVDSEHAL